MGLQKGQCAEWKKAPLLYCCNQVRTMNGGRIPRNVTAICETFKISCLMGRHHMGGGSENHSTDQLYRLEQWPNITLFSATSRLNQFGSKVLPGMFVGSCMRRNLARRHHDCRHWRSGADGRIRTPRQKAQCWRSVHADERWQLYIPSRRWNSQSLWRRSTSENIRLNPGSPRQRRRTRSSSRRIRRVFFNLTTRLIVERWWSQRRFLVYLRRVHLPSTRGTQSQTFHADWRIIPCSTELHYRYQDYRHDVGCEVGETYWRWNVDGGRELSDMWTCFTRFTILSEEATGWIYMVREETDEKTTDLVARQIMARNVETYVWCIKTLRETKVGHRETKALQCQTTERNILHWTKRRRIQAHNKSRS